MSSRPAAGTEGYLLIYPDLETAVPTDEIGFNGKPVLKCDRDVIVFRIYEYDENGKHKMNEKGLPIYKDYKIRHHDLKIKLLDGAFFETEKGNFIDYPLANGF